MTSSLKKRLVHLDFIKTFAIYLVCFYHFNNFRIDFLGANDFGLYRNYFLKGIASTAVPLFFMVNGYLMLNSKRKLSLKNHTMKILRISIVTVIWSIILMYFASILKGNEYNTIKSFLYSLSTLESGTLNQLWYIYALICIYILYPIIKELYDKEDKKLLYYFLATFFIFSFGNVFLNIIYNIVEFINGKNTFIDNGYNFFRLTNVYRGISAFSFVYFIIGGLLGKYIEENMENIKTYIFIIALIIGQSLLFAYSVIMTISNGVTFDIVFPGYDTIMTLIMSISIFVISFKLEDKLSKLSGILKIIGDNTLGIYFIHEIVGWALIGYYRSIPYSTNIFMNIGFGFVVMGISLLISLIIKKIPIIKKILKI